LLEFSLSFSSSKNRAEGVIALLRHQEKLPLLPVPALDNLFDFLNWIKPIVNDEEFEASKEALNEFLKPGGDGEKLHGKLIELSRELDTSWLPPFWNEMYLEYRGELVCNKNYYAGFDNTRIKSRYTVSTFAAKLVHEMMNAYYEISLKTFNPEIFKDRPLCMNQYNQIFKAVRLPRLMKDDYKTYPFDKHHHIVVYYKNNIFKVTTSTAEGSILSVDMLASKIQRIIDAGIEDRGNDAGVLTTADRDNAARLHEAIAARSVNRNSLDIINTAVFVLCIDPAPKNLKDFQKKVLLSDGKNRYFDKNCQIIITENLDIAINNEHTGADAIPWFNIIDRALNKIIKDGESERINLIDASLPEELEWHLSDDVKARLKEQLVKHQEFADNIYVIPLQKPQKYCKTAG
jgi:carnitine O-acetyltransferase